MKKVLFCLFTFLIALACVFATNVKAEEYTFIDGEDKFVIETIDEKNCVVTLTYGEETDSMNGTYVIEDDVLTLTLDLIGSNAKFKINGNDLEPIEIDGESFIQAQITTIMENGSIYFYPSEEYCYVGDTIDIEIRPSLFYIATSVTHNGVELVENENEKGFYELTLVEGENIIEVKTDLDRELLKDFAPLYEDIKEGNWKEIFDIKTIVTIILSFLDGTLLIAMVRNFIKDKKLADKTEKAITTVIESKITPEVKEIVSNRVEEVLKPFFDDNQQTIDNIYQAISVLTKAMALSQQDTPEARIAILDCLLNSNVKDEKVIVESKEVIVEKQVEKEKAHEEILESINNIKEENIKEIEKYDGTSI